MKGPRALLRRWRAGRCCYNPSSPSCPTLSRFMSIAQNRKAFHEFFIEQKFEAGLALEGWEVKAIRAGRVQLKEAYVIVRNNEIFLIGCHISPLPSASTHFQPDPVRTRKLLLHGEE